MVLEMSVCDGSSCPCNDSNKGVDFPSCDSKCLYEWVVFVVFSSMTMLGENVVQDVSSMKCIWWFEVSGNWLLLGAPSTLRMSNLNLAMHVYYGNRSKKKLI